MSKKKRDYSLDLHLIFAPFDERVFNERKKMQREVKFSLKRIAIGGTPSLLGLVGMAITANPILALIGVGISGIETVGMMAYDIMVDQEEIDEQIKKINGVTKKDEVIDICELAKKDEFNPVEIKEPSEYYTPEFREAVEDRKTYKPSDEQLQYEAALEKQQEERITTDNTFYNKEESIEILVDEIEKTYLLYKLPPMEISNFNWDVFFDCTYEFFVEHGIEEKYYDKMSFIIKMTLANVLTNSKEIITIFDFIEMLRLIEELVKEIKMYNVVRLKKEILSKLSQKPIININDYNKKKS